MRISWNGTAMPPATWLCWVSRKQASFTRHTPSFPDPTPPVNVYSCLEAVHIACAGCSTGKSTLLNALIGARILPTSNVPETARIARLQHAPECMEPVLAGTSGGQPIIGAAAVHERLELLNKQVLQLCGPDVCCQDVLPLPVVY